MKLDDFDKLRSDYDKQNILDNADSFRWVSRGILAFFVVVALVMGGCPMYNVWEQGLTGQAELARAEQNRQIKVSEALAKKESAGHLADAEVERAKGAAKANEIVKGSLGGSEGYLRWLFIEKLGEIPDAQIIYLPTEAGMPILEAARLQK